MLSQNLIDDKHWEEKTEEEEHAYKNKFSDPAPPELFGQNFPVQSEGQDRR